MLSKTDLHPDLRKYQLILVPQAIDAIVLNSLSINAISIRQILFDVLDHGSIADIADHQLQQLITYTAGQHLALAGFDAAGPLLHKLKGALECDTILPCNTTPEPTHRNVEHEIVDVTYDQLHEYNIYASDNHNACRYMQRQGIDVLLHTELGQRIYRSGQYLIYKHKGFYPHNTDLLDELSYYIDELPLEQVFKQHLLAIGIHPNILLSRFIKFLEYKQSWNRYILELYMFLSTQLDLVTPDIYPVRCARFFQQSITDVLITHIIDPYTLAGCQQAQRILRISDTNTLRAQPAYTQFIFTVSEFLQKSPKFHTSTATTLKHWFIDWWRSTQIVTDSSLNAYIMHIRDSMQHCTRKSTCDGELHKPLYDGELLATYLQILYQLLTILGSEPLLLHTESKLHRVTHEKFVEAHCIGTVGESLVEFACSIPTRAKADLLKQIYDVKQIFFILPDRVDIQ